MQWILKKIAVESLKEWGQNPRRLLQRNLEQLKDSIKKFGIAEPIVCNTDLTICGGHGRLKVLKELNIKYVDCYLPKKKLTPKEFEELNIRLNKNIAGEWDFDKLANEFELPELLEWGFNEKELTGIDDLQDGEEIEIPRSVQLVPPKEYILIMCEPNSTEWEELKEKLQLKRVRRGGYKKGSCFDDIDLERVIEYKDFRNRIKNAYSNTK